MRGAVFSFSSLVLFPFLLLLLPLPLSYFLFTPLFLSSCLLVVGPRKRGGNSMNSGPGVRAMDMCTFFYLVHCIDPGTIVGFAALLGWVLGTSFA